MIAGGQRPLFDVHGMFWKGAVSAQCNGAVGIKLNMYYKLVSDLSQSSLVLIGGQRP